MGRLLFANLISAWATEKDIHNVDNYLSGISRKQGSFLYTYDNMLTLPEELAVDFYCILDIYVPGEKPVFFADKKELQAAFVEKYCIDIINWEEISDEEISAWTKRLEEDLTELLINEL